MSTYDALIVGGDSRIGGMLLKEFEGRGKNAIGTTRRGTPSTVTHLNLLEPWAAPIFRYHDWNARVVYFCAAVSRFLECANNPQAARMTNVVGPWLLARELIARGSKVVYLSSSSAAKASESTHGKLKLEAEQCFADFGDNACCVRFGPVISPDRKPYPDGDYQPVHPQTVVNFLADKLENFVWGKYHLVNDNYSYSMVGA